MSAIPDAAMSSTSEKDAPIVPPNGAVDAQNQHQQYARWQHPTYRAMIEGQDTQAFGGALQVGNWQPYEHRKLANPAPLGLSAFALTTFVLSALNMHARDTAAPNIVISLAFGYGGLVQLLAGMWEMATGNTFGATALSSYGGFWISYAIILTPAFHVLDPYTKPEVANVLGFYLFGWFIFTTLLVLCTLRSTLALFLLFFTLDLAFLFLACEQMATNLGNATAALALQKTGGLFGFLAAFLAWYNALAGIQDSSNSFFQVPVIHFPWSEHANEMRKQKSAEHQA